jgi:hypothetical protein
MRFNSSTMTVTQIFKLLLAISLAGLASCSSYQGEGNISKVNIYKLDGKKGVVSADPSISFEQKYYLYGAVSNEEVVSKFGTYYRVHWSVKDASEPVKLLLQYRQSLTGPAIHTKEIVPDKIKGSNMTEFSVIGDEITKQGTVTAWRVSVLRGKQELASTKSYLWE